MDCASRSFSGALVRRVIDRSRASVAAHAHDWPVLSIFVLGSYENRTELGQRLLSGPSAILYRAGAVHENVVGPWGFEQIEIEFDPAWLGGQPPAGASVLRYEGPTIAARSGALVTAVMEGDEEVARRAVRQFLHGEAAAAPSRRPPWMDLVDRRLRREPTVRIHELADEAGLHPAWLGTAYRRIYGETLAAASARLRVERAACRLRESDAPAAIVAAETGFCDQSHMIRTFQRVLGRRPSDVREDRASIRTPQSAASR